MANQEFCSRCYDFQFCGLQSSYESNIKLVPETDARRLVRENPHVSSCNHSEFLSQLDIVNSEQNETEYSLGNNSFPVWFSGLMETTGSIDFKILNKPNEKTHIYPRIRIKDDNPDRCNHLYEAIIKVQGYSSRLWKKNDGYIEILGFPAAEFSSFALSHSISRKPLVQLYETWIAAETYEQKRNILAQYKNLFSNRKNDIQPNEYSSILTSPLFLAGIFDGCCSYTVSPRSDRPGKLRKEIRATTRNIALLHALRDQFSGSLTTSRSDSTEWRLGGEKAEELYLQIRPYLQITQGKDS